MYKLLKKEAVDVSKIRCSWP